MGFGISELLVIVAAIMFMFGGKKFTDWIVRFKDAQHEVLSQINPKSRKISLKDASTFKANKKLFYIPISLNGCKYIKKMLTKNRAFFPDENETYYSIKEKLNVPDDCISFAVVRNPWERLVRYYFNHNKRSNSLGFDTFVRQLDNPKSSRIPFLQYDQSHYIVDKENRVLVDHVIKYENLKQDFIEICKKANLGSLEYKFSNYGFINNYQSYYSEETKKKVTEFYKRDVELFGYSFDDNDNN